MNDGKSTDKTEAQPITESRSNNEAQGLDLRRRRLIRGAAGIAPVVLTLRSGAAAAALSGCAPTINGLSFYKTDNSGSTAGRISPPTDLVINQKCLLEAPSNLINCDPSPSNTVDVKPVTPGSSVKATVTSDGSDFYCGAKGAINPNLVNANVVIVSAGTSIVF